MLEGVLNGKGRLFELLPEDSMLVLNDIKDECSKYGTVARVQLCVAKGTAHHGAVFVEMLTAEDSLKTLTALAGRTFILRPALRSFTMTTQKSEFICTTSPTRQPSACSQPLRAFGSFEPSNQYWNRTCPHGMGSVKQSLHTARPTRSRPPQAA